MECSDLESNTYGCKETKIGHIYEKYFDLFFIVFYSGASAAAALIAAPAAVRFSRFVTILLVNKTGSKPQDVSVASPFLFPS